MRFFQRVNMFKYQKHDKNMMNDAIRFIKKIKITASCWVWQGVKHKGYGQFHYNGKTVYAHRFSYELNIGKIPSGLQLDHLCRVRECVNPTHLEPVTNKINSYRGYSFAGINSRKTHCPKGHEYNIYNTIHRKNGRRACRTCKKIWNKNYRKKMRMR